MVLSETHACFCRQIFSMLRGHFRKSWWFGNPKSESGLVNTSTQNHQVNNHPACTAVSPQGQTEQRSNGAFHFEFLEASEVGILKKKLGQNTHTFFGRHTWCNIEEFFIVSLKLLLLLSSKYMLCFFWIIQSMQNS